MPSANRPYVVSRDIFESNLVKQFESRDRDCGFSRQYQVGISGSLDEGTRSRINRRGYMSVYRVHRLDTGN